MSEPVLKVENLVKDYGSFRAVDDISFAVPRGKVIGFLGPNGAGKTTTIQILIGVTDRTSGQIKFFDKEFGAHREQILRKINFASSFNALQGRISVFENLVTFGHLYELENPKKKVLDLLEYFEIRNLSNERYWNLSAGQKTRVNLIKALLNEPELLLLDEPTASLDPDIADKVLSLIETLRSEKSLSILYTSHDMSEITRICDEVIFLDRGKIVAHDTPLGLTKRIKKVELIIIFDGPQDRVDKFLSGQKLVYSFTHTYTVHIECEEQDIPKIIFGLSKENIYLTDIETKKPTLEHVFIDIARGAGNVI